MTTKSGKVLFVGAGPGDPKLITVKGLEAIRSAHVLVYDRLVNEQLLEEASEQCERIYCGKKPSRHPLPQQEINQTLVNCALEGKTVVRLKGGDPSVFGRVGEEAAFCRQHHVPFEIIPGITSGIAASTYAGIPLTHRDYASSFAVVTGHRKSEATDYDWDILAQIDTLVIYMGVQNIGHIQQQLMNGGKDAQTPVAIIRWGSLAEQQTWTTTLQNVKLTIQEKHISSPAIIVIGEVVRLREELAWFEEQASSFALSS